MADATKYVPIGVSSNNHFATDLKSIFSILKARKTVTFAYTFTLVFVFVTVFLAFSPSSNASSPWFTNIFSSSTTTLDSHKSQFINKETFKAPSLVNTTQTSVNSSQDVVSVPKNSTLQGNSTTLKGVSVKNQTLKSDEAKSVSSSDSASSAVKGVVSNNHNVSSSREDAEWLKSLIKCDFFDGKWVKDDSYPLYDSDSCTDFFDEQFNCIRNGRPDKNYQKYKWKPKGCNLPRLDGRRMLDMLRGKRLVFVGDSLNRNMWESLICILRNAVKDKSRVYEANGRVYFRGEASYSFIFKDYDFTVELFVSPFLVQEWEMPDKNGTKKETLRLDLVGRSSDRYKDADIIVFNTGHWWTHDKTSKGEDYYQEGSHVYHELNVLEAFRKAITTWSRWVDANVNRSKSMVFFRGYSASHFSGGQWNSGGACDSETAPIDNEKYLNEYPPKMRVLEKVLKYMKTHVTYLNITRMTDFRKDGHPSIFRKQNLSTEEKKSALIYQDCSHWCLPGVPDAWNEVLYAKLLMSNEI
ncbi:hypothetical protein Lal_00003875 [Lupinus albus]|uniref:Putative PMR5 domain, PC-Esterase n=1 Tax=Lupinus albus TaxID=3870 RepID=A0A6A5PAT3_LUPAL|nr:putative PMR5 domain, PC-Esterase [Lupinus albus]KAF1893960.1 hypothetical protein Lal_00003875 [Lupinus albus]